MLRIDWRKTVPPRRGWLQLLVLPSSVMLTAGFLLTVVGKAAVLGQVENVSFWPAVLPWVVANDAVVYFGMAAMFAVVEKTKPVLRFLTIALAVWFAGMALINAGLLLVMGEQLTGQSFDLGLDRLEDLWLIVGRLVSDHLLLVALLTVALVGLPSVIRWRSGKADASDLARAHCAATLTVAGFVIVLLWPPPLALPARHIGENATLGWNSLVAGDAGDFASDLFRGYDPPGLVSDDEIARFRAQPFKPNVLLIILESTRLDHTSLAKGSKRSTPYLSQLAKKGTHFASARAVIPHTTKSVFTMLCGRFPLMQLENFEVAQNIQVTCVPEVLAKAGYRTALVQGAWGVFEDGPRLADKLGFDHFEAWENIQGESLGYFASDDRSLLEPAQRFIEDDAGTETGKEAPFLLVVHTSAVHHPYELPKRDQKAGMSDEQRALALVAIQDQLVGQLLALVDERGLTDNTIIVVVADHGEGFGKKGVRQHDNNYYEEGLRVPFVMSGPNVPVGIVDENVSLLDLAPSLLGRLGLRVRADAKKNMPGMDLFAGAIPMRTIPFSCYYERRCRGFVQGKHKFVFAPVTGRKVYFDLDADPDEEKPLPVPKSLAESVRSMNATLDRFRTQSLKIKLGSTRPYGKWACKPDRACTHPDAIR